MPPFIRLALILFTILTFLFNQSLGSVYALSPEQKKLYNQNILYYDLGCSSLESGSSGSDIGSVWMVGDSITRGAIDHYKLKEKFNDKGIKASFNATGAASLTYGGDPSAGTGMSGLQAIQNDKNKIADSDAVVIAHGTNHYPAEFEAAIKKAVSAVKKINDKATIFWVNTKTKSSGNPAYSASGSHKKNKIIQEQSSKLGFTVIDIAGANIPLSSDGIHPEYSDAGFGKWGDVVVDGVTGSPEAEDNTSSGSDSGGSCSCPGTMLEGKDNAEKIWNFLIGEGFSPEQAAGFLGNFWVESHFDPSITESGGGGYGLAQWTGGRRTTVEAHIRSKGIEPYTNLDEKKPGNKEKLDRLLEVQLTFVMKELRGSESAAFASIKAAKTVGEAWRTISSDYERPAEPLNPLRGTKAQQYYDAFKGQSGGSGGSSDNDAGCGVSSASCEKPSGTPKDVVDNVALPIAKDLGFDDTPESVKQANAAHSTNTTSGNLSDHTGPPERAWAADISNGSSPTPEMNKLSKELADCFGFQPEQWKGDCHSITKGGYRFQLIYRTSCGGNHFNHVHIGVSKQ